jgi:hypothetical protein
LLGLSNVENGVLLPGRHLYTNSSGLRRLVTTCHWLASIMTSMSLFFFV